MPGASPVTWSAITGKPSLVATDNGYDAVGSFAIAQNNDVSNITGGGTIAGSSLRAAASDTGGNNFGGSAALSGTWRNISGNCVSGASAVYQRIA